MELTIDQLLARLKLARMKDSEATGQMKFALDTFLASDDVYTHQKQRHEQLSGEISELEASIRGMALDVYEATANKKPHEKVAIKIFETFKVVDPARVLAWVKTNLADALIYDDKKVKNYAMKIGPVDGTELGTEARAQIASEL